MMHQRFGFTCMLALTTSMYYKKRWRRMAPPFFIIPVMMLLLLQLYHCHPCTLGDPGKVDARHIIASETDSASR